MSFYTVQFRPRGVRNPRWRVVRTAVFTFTREGAIPGLPVRFKSLNEAEAFASRLSGTELECEFRAASYQGALHDIQDGQAYEGE